MMKAKRPKRVKNLKRQKIKNKRMLWENRRVGSVMSQKS